MTLCNQDAKMYKIVRLRDFIVNLKVELAAVQTGAALYCSPQTKGTGVGLELYPAWTK